MVGAIGGTTFAALSVAVDVSLTGTSRKGELETTGCVVVGVTVLATPSASPSADRGPGASTAVGSFVMKFECVKIDGAVYFHDLSWSQVPS